MVWRKESCLHGYTRLGIAPEYKQVDIIEGTYFFSGYIFMLGIIGGAEIISGCVKLIQFYIFVGSTLC